MNLCVIKILLNYMKELFLNHLKEMIVRYEDTYISRIFHNYTYETTSYYGDSGKLIEYLERNKDYFKIEINKNEILFQLNIPSTFSGDMETLKVLSDEVRLVEKKSKEIFWNEERNKNYAAISNFNLFLDFTIPKQNYWKMMLHSPFYNVEGLLEYYKNSFELFFNDFNLNFVKNKKTTYYKPWVHDWFVGVEVNYTKVQKSLKAGEFDKPSYSLKLFKLKKGKPYSFFNLGEIGFPLFKLSPFYTFVPGISRIQISELEAKFDEGIRSTEIDNENIHIYNNGKHEETIKKHIFYYFELSAQTTKDYLDFMQSIWPTLSH